MFVDDYQTARAAFIGLARARGAAIASHVLPGVRGAQGEALAVDVAVLGPPDASRGLLIVSGVHGLEAAPGSAAQRAFLAGSGALAPDLKVVLAHAVNPWGFSWGSRTDQDNVDLNRNFIDFDAAPPANPAYAELHPALCPAVWSDEAGADLSAAAVRCLKQGGMAYLLSGMTGGQYEFADGLNFGGRRPAWSRGVMEAIVAAELGRCEKVGYLEWHSGIGPSGQLQFVCTHPRESESRARVKAWWGERATLGAEAAIASGKGEAPAYRGLLLDAVPTLLPRAVVAGAVVEFGTYGEQQVLAGLMIDRWLKFGAGNRSGLDRPALEARKREVFFPADPGWRDGALRQALEVQARALAGVADW